MLNMRAAASSAVTAASPAADKINNTQITQMTQISQKGPRTYEIIGAAMGVHKALGRGFLEAVYHEALSIEFDLRNIPFQKEMLLSVYYKDCALTVCYKADFVCYETIIVELKALNKLSGTEEAQVINYPKTTGLDTGLLINFGAKSLEYKRFVLNNKFT